MSDFGEREFDELASFLRSAFRARRVEKRDHTGDGTLELRLLGRGDTLQSVLLVERACLERHAVTDVRSYLAEPPVKKRIAAAGPKPVRLASDDIDRRARRDPPAV